MTQQSTPLEQALSSELNDQFNKNIQLRTMVVSLNKQLEEEKAKVADLNKKLDDKEPSVAEVPTK